MAMREYRLFLERVKPVTNTQLYDEEIKENISNVVILCCFMK